MTQTIDVVVNGDPRKVTVDSDGSFAMGSGRTEAFSRS